jgi:hypothetical protein
MEARVMKRLFSLAIFWILIGSVTAAFGQFRKDVENEYNYTGNVVSQSSYSPNSWADKLNMTMSHSYSMNFASVGGQYQNINMYTNTMLFDMGEKLTGRLDLSVSHSPFGPSTIYGTPDKGTDAQFFIRNAELNYKISDKASIHLQFRQVPSGLGFNPYFRDPTFYGNRFDRNPFYR